MKKKEFDGLEKYMDAYISPLPDESDLSNLVKAVEPYVPKRKRHLPGHLAYLLGMIKLQHQLLPLWFYPLSAFIMIMGILMVLGNRENALILFMAAAPIPGTIGYFLIFRGFHEGTFEMELSCTMTPVQLLVSRLLHVLSLNIGLTYIASTVITVFTQGAFPWIFLLLWLIPLLMNALLSLIVSLLFNSQAAVITFSILWMAVIAALQLNWHGLSTFITHQAGILTAFLSVLLLSISGILIMAYVLKEKKLEVNRSEGL